MKQNKYFLFLILFTVFLFMGANFIFALEVPLPGLGANPTLPEYVKYFFTFGIGLAGILALISFTIGAIGLINPNVEAHKDAKDRMKGSILGLILTVASFIIINTINPTLTNVSLTALPQNVGIFLTDGNKDISTAMSNPDNSTLPTGFNTIKYTCAGDKGPALLVWLFPKTNYAGTGTGYDGISVVGVNCNSQYAIGSAGSFMIEYRTPGVYFFLEANCRGYGSSAVVSSQDSIEDPFGGHIKSVRIFNGDDPTANIRYGVIFHKETGLESAGACNLPITSTASGSQCLSVNNFNNTSAANIFILNNLPGSAGDGVSFYSKPFGELTGTNAGFLNIPDAAINSSNLILPGLMDFQWTNVNVPDQYKNSCQSFQKCPGSILIKGSYLVGLYSGGAYCQIFQDVPNGIVPNLKAQPFKASGASNAGFDSVYIIPTQ